jgi:SAM-dependent methyltransferase
VPGLWRVAEERSAQIDAAAALEYDRYRPRYPEALFDDLVEMARRGPGDPVIEFGAGTGIATAPLVDRGLVVTAIEPAQAMAAVAAEKLGERATVAVGRFEEWVPADPVELVVAFNAWHWVNPEVAVDLVAELITPGGVFAAVWTEVVSWGQAPFEDLLAQAFGSPWPKDAGPVISSLRRVEEDDRFSGFEVRRHRFERVLDADTFVAVSRTYGGRQSEERDRILWRIIDDQMGGTVTKVEEAALYLTRRVGLSGDER